MKQSWKKELKKIYQAPEPKQKEMFLKSLEAPGLSTRDFILSQLGYIRKWNWLLAGLLFIIMLFGAKRIDYEITGLLSAFVPLLALATVAESSRSFRYKMEELELSSRFSLKTVVMARLGILGGGNLIMLGVVGPVLLWRSYSDLLYLGVYVLVPYLTTCFLNLLIVRKVQGKESLYWCFGAAVLVSGIYTMFEMVHLQVYHFLGSASWIGVIVLLCAMMARECIKITKQSEEYIWNL